MRKRLLVILQDISRAQEHEWFIEYINRDNFELHFVLINGKDSYMDHFLRQNQIPVYYYDYKSKKSLLPVFFSVLLLLLRKKIDILHTHLFEASLIGLTAGFIARVPVRIYTRHYSDYHHVWFPGAVKYDIYNNFLATAIVATSKNVKNILSEKEKVPEEKIHLIHHGIDITDYEPGVVTKDRINTIRTRYNVNSSGPVIGAISRFTELKGVQYLIPAFSELLVQYPEAILVLANASGDYQAEIFGLLEDIDPARYRIIVFENDIAALYRIFDCFVHIPINLTAEAFGQTYLESLASMIPSVFTLSGIAPEFIEDKINAMVVPYCDSRAVATSILYLLKNHDIAEEMSLRGFDWVKNLFDIHIKIRKLEQLYSIS